MGWTSYRAEHYTKGKVDRKAEIDEMYTQTEHDGSDFNGGTCHYPGMKVIKSTMKGSRWYGVIEITNSTKNVVDRVAQIVLTSTRWNDGMNFGYKEIGSYNSGYNDFPTSMIKLLSDPSCDEDRNWRTDCIKDNEKAKSGKSLSNLPIGTVIKFKRWDGEETKVYKHEPTWQFKTPFWMYVNDYHYIPKKYIPDDFEIVTE